MPHCAIALAGVAVDGIGALCVVEVGDLEDPESLSCSATPVTLVRSIITTAIPIIYFIAFAFSVYGLRFTVYGSRFTVHGSRFTIHDLRITITGAPLSCI